MLSKYIEVITTNLDKQKEITQFKIVILLDKFSCTHWRLHNRYVSGHTEVVHFLRYCQISLENLHKSCIIDSS